MTLNTLRCLALLFLVSITGCSQWRYQALTLPDALPDLHTRSQDGITVSVAILTDEQAQQHFGVDIGEHDIQAIWLSISNDSDRQLWFLRAVLDPDFYPADEVAMLNKRRIPGESFEPFQQRLRDQSMRLKIEAYSEERGFVFTPKAIGGRYVDVRLVEDVFQAELRRQGRQATPSLPTIPSVEAPNAADTDLLDLEFRFGFAIPLPDGIFDYERLDPEKTYAGLNMPELDLDGLRRELAALPCCSLATDEQTPADPLNIVIVGNSPDVLNSLSRAGWSFTHRITAESVTRLLGAALSGDSYPVAPVSNLIAFDRHQDFALQRARTGISQRNHMRLWLAPFTHRGKQVWVGQISRDIGIKLTPKSPSITTHVIDPEVDQAREYLLQSLLAEGLVEAFGFGEGSRAARRDQPAMNHVGDPYFSDGKRLVLILSPQPVPYGRVRSLMWEQSAAPVAEGQLPRD